MTDLAGNYDLEEQRARINRAQEETRKFAAEQHKLTAEFTKLSAEQNKLAAEVLKLGRDHALAPWQLVLSSMAAGAALFGAGAAFIKLLG